MRNFIYTLVLLGSFSCNSQDIKNEIISNDFEWLSNYMENFQNLSGFSGGALIAKDGNIVFKKVVGWRNVVHNTPHDFGTRFNIMSGAKMFTSVCIGQLIDQKLIAPVIH